MRYISCQGIWHLLNKCPNNYKNLGKFWNNVLGTNKESYITNLNTAMMKAELKDLALFTVDKQKITGLVVKPSFQSFWTTDVPKMWRAKHSGTVTTPA